MQLAQAPAGRRYARRRGAAARRGKYEKGTAKARPAGRCCGAAGRPFAMRWTQAPRATGRAHDQALKLPRTVLSPRSYASSALFRLRGTQAASALVPIRQHGGMHTRRTACASRRQAAQRQSGARPRNIEGRVLRWAAMRVPRAPIQRLDVQVLHAAGVRAVGVRRSARRRPRRGALTRTSWRTGLRSRPSTCPRSRGAKTPRCWRDAVQKCRKRTNDGRTGYAAWKSSHVQLSSPPSSPSLPLPAQLPLSEM